MPQVGQVACGLGLGSGLGSVTLVTAVTVVTPFGRVFPSFSRSFLRSKSLKLLGEYSSKGVKGVTGVTFFCPLY